MSQYQLASKLKRSQSLIAGWEKGRSEPQISDICKMADIFGVTTDYLLERTDNPLSVVPRNTPYIEANPHEQAILEAYRAANDTAQNIISGILGLSTPAELRAKTKRA